MVDVRKLNVSDTVWIYDTLLAWHPYRVVSVNDFRVSIELPMGYRKYYFGGNGMYPTKKAAIIAAVSSMRDEITEAGSRCRSLKNAIKIATNDLREMQSNVS